MRFRGHEADITISDVSKSQEDDGRVCRFLSSARLWCMPCDVCCNPTFKMLFKDFFFLNLPVRCPQAKIPEQLSLPPLLPAVLSFHPLPSVFIFCWKKENRVPSKLPNIHFEIYPLPPPPEPIPNPHISLFHVFPSLPFPFLSLCGCRSTSLSSRTDFVPSCERGDVWMLACCLFINLFSPSLGPDMDLSMWPEETRKNSPGL